MNTSVESLTHKMQRAAVGKMVGVGGHDGGGGIGAALLVRSQLCGGGRDAPGKGVDDHGLTDDTGGCLLYTSSVTTSGLRL